MKRTLLAFFAAVCLGIAALAPATRGQSRPPAFRIVEASIPEMRAALEQRRLTSRELVSLYLIRIAQYEHRLHAAIAVNAKALDEADQLDLERAQGHVRGPLHGIPIALKDNIHTTD